MTQSDLKNKIMKVLEEGPKPKVAALATVDEKGRPRVRIMVVKNDGFTLFSTTSIKSTKISHIRNNDSVSLSVSRDISNLASDYLTIEGTAEVLTDARTKKNFWNENLKIHFTGPEDPDYCILKYTPKKIEYFGAKGPEIFNL